MNTTLLREDGALTSIESAGLEHDPARVERMADLFRLYPDIGDAEKAELLLFLRRGRQIEIGMVSARDGIAERLSRFRHDHGEHFRLRPYQILGFILLVVGPLTALAWACIG